MTDATSSPAENDTMEDRTAVIPTAAAVVRPVVTATAAKNSSIRVSIKDTSKMSSLTNGILQLLRNLLSP